jgi:pimeloyl-ACP methyl ester carboxylesterase
MAKFVSLREVKLHVVDEGSGPPLLLIHGFPLDHTMWRHQIERFKATHRVIAPDLRGFGQSDVSTGTVTMRKFANDLVEVLERLDETRPVVVCGLSMGGYIAWQFAQHRRQQLAALILCDTKAAGDTSDAALTRLESAERLEREGTSFLANSMLPKLFGDLSAENQPPYVQETAAVIMRTDPRACAAAQRGMAEREDYRPRLADIDVPTLVICGEKDVISPPKEMQEIAASIPGAKYVEIPGASHLAPLEKPEPVNQAMAEFLASLPPLPPRDPLR